MRRKNEARDLEIFNLRLSGLTYKAIAQRYGISVDRARQVYCKQERLKRLRDSHSVYAALSVRTLNCLGFERVNPRNLDEICSLDAAYLLRSPNFGRKSLQELEAYLASHGRRLGDVAFSR